MSPDGNKTSTKIVSHHILIHGGPEGHETNRAQIVLYGAEEKTVAFLLFREPHIVIENTSESEGIIRMQLPSASFGSTLNLLHNEKPLYIHFAQGRGHLSTSKELLAERQS